MPHLKIQQRPLLSDPSLFSDLPPFVAEILARRGVDSAQQLQLKLQYLLAPNLKGLQPAIELIDQAIDQQKKIVIVGDYDVDGATSTALMVLVLKQMGAQVNYLVPDRFKYGYGLTEKIADLAWQRFQPDLLITVDNGISSHGGVAQAQSYGMQVIITDHHLTTKATPSAEAVLNPNQFGCNFPSKALAGVGVAFYLLANLASHRKKLAKATVAVAQYLDLVALGTYADVAALDYNNRILIHAGLQRIQQQQCRVGILALLDVAQRSAAQLKAQDLGFVLGPRLNAAGRMDTMELGIECLLAEDFSQAQALAQQLEHFNKQRRDVEAQMKQQAIAAIANLQLDQQQVPAALVLYDEQWHQGVIGIVAGRLKEQFYRPAIVFAPDEDGIHLKGSARSIDGIHIRDAIERVAEQYPQLVRFFGGHAAAAGLTIAKQDFPQFQQVFEQLIASMDTELFDAVLWTDGMLTDEAIAVSTVDLLDQLTPWGQKFPKPLFEGKFRVLDYRWLKEKHLKLRLALNSGKIVDAIGFFAAEHYEFNPSRPDVELVYELTRNEFNGQVNVQLQIVHLQQG